METKLARIAELAKARPQEKFTSLAHLLSKEMLEKSHRSLESGKAPGVDEIGKAEYEANLQANLEELVGRLKRKAYRPQPVKRVYIPKAGTNKKRPLGIPAYEDKIIQYALKEILSRVYEADFLDCSCGFRPQRGCHDALQLLNEILTTKQVNYIVDADNKGFFDHVDHEWMMKFLGQRIADPSIHHIIRRLLKAGYMEQGKWQEVEEGTPQGGVISPLLANVYLHYSVDLWFEKVVRRRLRGEAYMVRYADDIVFCFQYETEAKRFYEELKARLGKFNLEVAEEKTKIIQFGQHAEAKTEKETSGKPDTFDFLGFTHYCGESQKGEFRVKRKTSRKKMKASLVRMKEWLRTNRVIPIWDLVDKLKSKLRGYYQYYGITDNIFSLGQYAYKVRMLLFKWLNRRSQKRSFTWEKFDKFLDKCALPKPRIRVSIFKRRPHIGYI